jgi:hypothetical protein
MERFMNNGAPPSVIVGLDIRSSVVLIRARIIRQSTAAFSPFHAAFIFAAGFLCCSSQKVSSVDKQNVISDLSQAQHAEQQSR